MKTKPFVVTTWRGRRFITGAPTAYDAAADILANVKGVTGGPADARCAVEAARESAAKARFVNTRLRVVR